MPPPRANWEPAEVFFWCNRQEENAEATSEHNVFNSPLLVGDLFRILRRPGGSGQGERSTGL